MKFLYGTVLPVHDKRASKAVPCHVSCALRSARRGRPSDARDCPTLRDPSKLDTAAVQTGTNIINIGVSQAHNIFVHEGFPLER